MRALEAPMFFNTAQKSRKDKLTKTAEASARRLGFSDTCVFL
jgi:hypothetical protein